MTINLIADLERLKSMLEAHVVVLKTKAKKMVEAEQKKAEFKKLVEEMRERNGKL